MEGENFKDPRHALQINQDTVLGEKDRATRFL